MKVSVIGTGAMGSIYGSFFAKNNFDVLCYDVWDEHVDAINNKGLRVSGISGDHTEKKIRATTNFNELKDRDLYIIQSMERDGLFLLNHQAFFLSQISKEKLTKTLNVEEVRPNGRQNQLPRQILLQIDFF